MAVHGNLDGTRRSEFTVGPDEIQGVRKVGNEIALFDPVTGQKKLSEMGGSGGDAIINKIVMTTAGGMVYTNATALVVHS
jgi:hypothetical protein